MTWARAPWDESEVQRRSGRLQRLEAIANRRNAEYETDAEGRQILIGYNAVRNWLNYWLSQG